MLDEHFSAAVMDVAWHNVSQRAVLPCAEEDYFGESGATPTSPDSRRRYRRIRARGPLVIQRGGEALAGYTMDVSPAGIGFYSPLQLYPKERVIVAFEEFGCLELQITRCRRIRRQCYSCGGLFVHGNMGPSAYREFLRFLKV